MGEPLADLDAVSPASSAHRPFRAWALQHDLSSLLGGTSDWRVSAPDLGLEDTAADRPEDAFRGQGYLREALATSPRYSVRTRTSITLWAVALATDALNQVSPIGISMPTGAFWLTISLVAAALIFTIIVYPRISGTTFFVVEQSMLTFASLLIIYQCSVTGGAGSPYMAWFVLTSYYAAYLLPRGQDFANLVWFSLLPVAAFALDQSPSGNVVVLQVFTLIVTNWVVGFALIEQRRRENTLERTVTFMALADPLTSVANMRSFEEYLEELSRNDGQRFAIVMADMNGLKGANAVFGHDAGDGMLVRMGKLLLRASGERDQVARLGGDEFAVVLPSGSAHDLTRWRKEFDYEIERHNAAVRGRLPQISVAIGTAVYPDDGVRAQELIDVADRRMYEEKSAVVAPPYEIDTIDSSEPGRTFRLARFHDVPRHAVDLRERMFFSALNWFTGGVLAFAAVAIQAPHSFAPVAIFCGALGVVCAAGGIASYRFSRSMLIPRLLDYATLPYAFPFIWSTGGSSSPLMIVLTLPVAFYAQYFKASFALPRVAILIFGLLLAFVAAGDQTHAETTRLFTSIAAMLVVTGIMQYSSRQQVTALGLLRESAQIDRLTGLPNVHALRRDLQLALADARGGAQSSTALIMVDLDDFRRANTLAGHRGGDLVLRSVAERLADVSIEARIYRVDGDDFAVLADVAEESKLRDLAARYARAVEHEVRLDDAAFNVRASVGYCAHRPGQSGDAMVDAATAMVQERKVHKRGGGDSGGQVLL